MGNISALLHRATGEYKAKTMTVLLSYYLLKGGTCTLATLASNSPGWSTPGFVPPRLIFSRFVEKLTLQLVKPLKGEDKKPAVMSGLAIAQEFCG